MTIFEAFLGSIKTINDGIEKTTLKLGGGLPTEFSFYGGWDDHGRFAPGFFTPFNKNCQTGIKPAAATLGLYPALHLVAALTMPFPPILHFAISCCDGEWSSACSDIACLLFAVPIISTYFLSAAAFDLCKELTALLTRSIATLVDLCQTPNELDENCSEFGRVRELMR